ncbi:MULTISPECIES: DUF2290 domain-containing protein [unclassified Pseudoalteromonas]|uniref:DUF2290 domain-containing protein n=1 Tax=unclassified Pseudoalteromonas TaxID=194690 RepID=UPI0016038EEF|nr:MULTISPECIES: DUF2290 domain-containing protein [unclassified Pseudoalteromonas]MBB1335886.1 DUF2290 domain-containing protein [Pseudoalteromonas sp. SR41-6]MBB1461458.1 DUF2290 domain-containing protein [Pseudoalteromonas sp. SG41-8]MDN3382920.1 DUF2290 domain-containing protein [Pseudoalteromonas sp. APC 3358]
MIRQSFNQSIKATIALADKYGLLLQAGASNSFTAPAEVKHMTRRAKSYKEVYDAIVSYQSFNLMLTDKAVFQFTETEPERDVRLAYYPNPYRFTGYLSERRDALELLQNDEISEIEYEQLTSEADFMSDIPVIRYDLSLDQHCKFYHPAAHFHIGFHAENRWPVDRILTPKAFFFKTLCNYYPDKWKEPENYVGNKLENPLDRLYRLELSKNCPSISVNSPDHFAQIEAERLHFK